MEGELAPEFIYDQGVYYPAAGNYYEYVCTGVEPPTEWDGNHKFLTVDVQDQQFPGLQSENLSYVYYTPSYDYAQSPYNPFNPYIPGAVIGTDGPYIGSQQCFTNSPYPQTVVSPGYMPVISQSSSDTHTLLNGSPDPLLFSNGAVQYAPSLSSMSVTTTPLKVSFENLSLEPSHSSHQIQVSGRSSEGTGVNAGARKKFSPYGVMTNGGSHQVIQGTEHVSFPGVPSVRSPLKATFPANNGFTSSGSDVRGWAPVDRMRPRIQYSGVPNRSLGEQNMGPRTNKTRTQLTLPVTLKDYTTEAGTGNLDGHTIIHPDQYNRDDFPVDYPRDTKFFVIKSYSEDDVHKSIKYNVWSSTSSGNKKLDAAYEEAQRSSVGKSRKCPVFLFFSVNASGHFCGVAEMVGPVDFHKDMDFWLQDKWTGCFPVKWHIIKDVPNSSFRHIILENNEFRPVTSSRDTQEVQYDPGMSMLYTFKRFPLNTWILDDFMYYEERQRIMQEEKSLLLGSKTYVNSVSPPIFIPSIKPGEAITRSVEVHPPNAGEVPLPIASVNETKAKSAQPLEPNIRKMVPRTADEDDKQKNAELTQLNGTMEQPSKSDDAHVSAGGNPAIQPEPKQVKNHSTKQSSEAKSDQSKNHSLLPEGTDKLSPNDTHAVSRDSAKHAQGKRKGRPESVGCSDTQVPAKETDVFTVGSVEIEITDTSRLISGTLTIGSIPCDTKGPKS
ncbi:uncharacterized protein A4U43_C02F22310 [Asparagus officinalis]|uniref:YTH domain-containing family protein n=1 Tax=Asparagus officinalis TaxID=4686 RepID=A0A5P1FKN3_ASPOF|nr:uncharacterized protein LOC109831916 [Asparagus officinalis]ONK78778.1 uncharacterized protein A4U43_C02F22310 [Asparagus officinalis]